MTATALEFEDGTPIAVSGLLACGAVDTGNVGFVPVVVFDWPFAALDELECGHLGSASLGYEKRQGARKRVVY